MRNFIDLHLNPTDIKERHNMLRRAESMGYNAVGLTSYKKEIQSYDLDIITRMDLNPNTRGDLLNILRKIRRNVEIIAVECNSKEVARQAAKDHRVDILNFPQDHKRRYVWFDRQEAILARETNCSIEINLISLLNRDPIRLAELLRKIRTEIFIASKYDIPVILSSGATHSYELRDPRTLASTLNLLEIDEEISLDMISKIPQSIVKRNRRKLGESFIHPGVWRVKSAS